MSQDKYYEDQSREQLRPIESNLHEALEIIESARERSGDDEIRLSGDETRELERLLQTAVTDVGEERAASQKIHSRNYKAIVRLARLLDEPLL